MRIRVSNINVWPGANYYPPFQGGLLFLPAYRNREDSSLVKVDMMLCCVEVRLGFSYDSSLNPHEETNDFSHSKP